MKRWPLLVLLVAGVVCAGVGVVVGDDPVRPASFGWTAYSPLSGEQYVPGGLAGFAWARTTGAVLLALGAGAAGAAVAALVLVRRFGRPSASAD